ncbi:MAG: cob(I)yrinic acid a,c-diamide adenosyltransferase [Candidatus Schekmanbacteria bacterium]|nr:MAG: cob(I)yrinic acid a,c-diamide adenosyltransferase [Candidatus Schekmanbacteria bacterium]
MSISTGAGDKGTTSLYSGERVKKYSLRPEAYGTVDEFGAYLGAARCIAENPKTKEIIIYIQSSLFPLCTELATSPEKRSKIKKFIGEEEISQIELWIKELEEELELPPSLVLPGENLSSSLLHIARTVIRRAERRIVELSEKEEGVSPNLLKYVNRLSDIVYLLACLEAGGR